MKDLYKILGIDKDASNKEVKRGYFAMAKKYHPDAGDEAEIKKFYEVTEAYEILSDKEKRRAYDLTLNEGKIVSELVSKGPSVEAADIRTHLYAQFREKEARHFRRTIFWQGVFRVFGFAILCAGIGYVLSYFLHARLPDGQGTRVGGGIAGFVIGFIWSLGNNFDVDSFVSSARGRKVVKGVGWALVTASILYFVVILVRRFV